MKNPLPADKPASINGKTKNRNVLILFYEPCKSGISRHIKYLLQALQSENVTFWIICSSNDAKIPAFFSDVMQVDHLVMVPPNRFFSFKGFIRTWKMIRRQKIDIVHIHNLGTMLWGYAGSIFAGQGKIIFTPHIDTVCAGSTQWFFRKMWRIFNPFTSTLIALSQAQKEWFLRWKIVDEEKITVINNHIPENELRSKPSSNSIAIPTLHNLGPDTLIVSQIGRLQRQKDPFFLIRVALLLRKRFPKIIFLLVGEGPLKNKLEETIEKLNLQDNVILAGHQNNIPQILELSDVIALTSRWEGMPYTLLEAICYKKAVIATDIPGNCDLITDGKNGFLVHSEEEFAKKIIILSQSQELRDKMGETGYRMFRHLFDIKNMNRLIVAIYNNAIDR